MGSMIYWLRNQRLVRVEEELPGGKLLVTFLATGRRAVIRKRSLSSAAKEFPGCKCQACEAVRELSGSADADAPLIVDAGTKTGSACGPTWSHRLEGFGV
jgi:hypothetical protein